MYADLEERLRAVVANGIFKSRSAWLKSAGVSSGYFSSLKRGIREGKRSGVGLDVLERLSRAAHVELEWLAYGRGPMHVSDRTEVRTGVRPPTSADSAPRSYGAMLQAIARVEASDLRIALSDFLAVRLHDEAAKSTVDEFLTRQWGSRVRSAKAWAMQLEVAYESRKKLYAVGDLRGPADDLPGGKARSSR